MSCGLPGVCPPQTYTSTPSPGAKLDPISTVSMYLASKGMLNGRNVSLRKRFSQDLVVKLARYSIFYMSNRDINICMSWVSSIIFSFYLFIEEITTKKVITAWIAKFILLKDSESFIDFIVGNSPTNLCPPVNEIKFSLYNTCVW